MSNTLNPVQQQAVEQTLPAQQQPRQGNLNGRRAINTTEHVNQLIEKLRSDQTSLVKFFAIFGVATIIVGIALLILGALTLAMPQIMAPSLGAGITAIITGSILITTALIIKFGPKGHDLETIVDWAENQQILVTGENMRDCVAAYDLHRRLRPAAA